MKKEIPDTPAVQAIRLQLWVNYLPLSGRIAERIVWSFWKYSATESEEKDFRGPQFLNGLVEKVVCRLEDRSQKTYDRWLRRRMAKAKYPHKIWEI